MNWPEWFAVEHESRNGTALLRLRGELDLASASDLVAYGRSLLATGSALTIDVGDLTFIDSSGLQALVTIVKDAASSRRQARIVGAGPRILRLIDMAGLQNLFSDHVEPPAEPPAEPVG